MTIDNGYIYSHSKSYGYSEYYLPRNLFAHIHVRNMRLSKTRRGFYYELYADDQQQLDEAAAFLHELSRNVARDFGYYSQREHAWYTSTVFMLTLSYFIPDLAPTAKALVAWAEEHEPHRHVHLWGHLGTRYTPHISQLKPYSVASFYARPDAE